MTLTEYIMRSIFGAPDATMGGNPAWRCPWHQDKHAALILYPPNEKGKQKFRCHGCGRFGDAYDVIWHRWPDTYFGERKTIYFNFKRMWEAGGDCDCGPAQTPYKKREHDRAIASAWNEWDRHRNDPDSSSWLDDISRQHRVKPSEVVAYDQDHDAWLAESFEKHIAECHDPDCSDQCVRTRLRRGLNRMTRKQFDDYLWDLVNTVDADMSHESDAGMVGDRIYDVWAKRCGDN